MKVFITCNAAMSTGILELKLQDLADQKGNGMQFKAVPLNELDKYLAEADVILCSPQIRFATKDLQAKNPDKKVLQMGIQEFGLMQADKIMAQIEEATK